VIYNKIIPTPSAVYLIGLAKSFSSLTLHITALSPTTGQVIETSPVSSSIEENFSDILTLTPVNTDTPLIVWIERGAIKSLQLTPELKGKPVSMKGAYSSISDVGLGPHGQFVGVKGDGSARFIKLNKEGSGLTAFWEFDISVCYVISPMDRLG
jgi:ER membrane protein complex subunit 1